MTVILEAQGIFYASVPKAACTSLKEFFFQIENGFAFRMFAANGLKRHIHHFYSTLPRDKYPEGRLKGLHRVAVVRDPVARFLSAYSNRVRHHKELSAGKAGEGLRTLGLEADPDVGLFVDRLESYIEAHPSIKHHTRPMVDFLGKDPGYFDRIYPMSELGQFAKDMNARAGTNVKMPHLQKGGPRMTRDALSGAQLDKIETFYKKDYAAFGSFF